MAKPTKRSPEVVQRILDGLSEGTPLTRICADADMLNSIALTLCRLRTLCCLHGAGVYRYASVLQIALESLAQRDGGTRYRITQEHYVQLLHI